MALLLAVPAAADNNDPSGKLIAEYTFDDETIKDSVGINHAILYNGKSAADPVFTEGVVGKALQLSQKGSIQLLWLSIPYDVFEDNQDSFTISMWYKASGYNTTGEDSELFSFYNTSVENFLFYSPASAAFQDKAFSMKWSGLNQSYGYANVITPYNANNWVHLVYCVDAVDGQSVITAYVNGAAVEVDQGGDWSNSLMSTLGIDNFTIGGKNPYKGGDTPSCLFYGEVDEVQIYAGALTNAEAAYIYSSAGFEAPPVPETEPTEPSAEPTQAPTEPSQVETEPQTEPPVTTEAPVESTVPVQEAKEGLNAGGIIGWVVAGVAVLALAVILVLNLKKKKQ